MGSSLNPDSEYLTLPSNAAIQPLDPSILTQPVWIDYFLTPGVTVPTRIPPQNTLPPPASPTLLPSAVATTPTVAGPTPTHTFVFFPATQTSVHSSPRAPTSTTTTSPATSIPTATSSPLADLQITKSDSVVVYSAGLPLTYTVAVINNGPGDAVGAIISDVLPPNLASWSWACTSQNNGASGCDPATDSPSNFSDTVDLPAGGSIVYSVDALARVDAIGSLVNTASIEPSADTTDPLPDNNSATDTDDLMYPLPYANIGSSKDDQITVMAPGGSVTLAFETALVVGGHDGWDLVLYELPNGTGIAMDLIILQISDGTNWYTVFNWGDNIPDTNSNLNIGLLGGQENDNRNFAAPPRSDVLYPFNSGTDTNPSTGIVLDLDESVPPGMYPYIRIISPSSGDMDGGCEIDGIAILP